MANPFLLSDDVLSDVVKALRFSISRVSADEMGATPVAGDLERVQRWLDSADASLEAAMQGRPMLVPPFPINGPRLRALEAEVDGVVAQRGGSPPMRRARALSVHTPLHLRLLHSMRRLDRAW